MSYEKFFITAAIDYVNSIPHIGHAYEKIAADILARYYRNQGVKVSYLVGTDEHGMKVAQAAQKNKITPKDFVDQISQKYQDTWKALNVGYDQFIRTTDPDHEKFVQEFLQKIYDNGEIYKDKYQGLYCVGCEEYKTENELDKGKICPLHQKECDLIEEDIYFFKLSKYQNQIIEAIQSRKLVIEPESRRNEIFRFLAKEPLKDLAITRSKVPWGIAVPWDKNQTIYVWVDALLCYLSGGEGYWPPQLQLVGKDIFRFHAIIWPAMLMAAGYELPEKLFIHGFLTVNGQKMSKTLGNVLNPAEIAEVYGADALRYFLFREVPFGEDGDFSLARFDERYRADLANDLGNLLQRTLMMAQKYKLTWIYQAPTKKYPEIDKAIEELRFADALNLIWQEISSANKKIDHEKPWTLVETDKPKLAEIMAELLNTLNDVSKLIAPFMPETSEKMITQLKTNRIQPLFPRKKEED